MKSLVSAFLSTLLLAACSSSPPPPSQPSPPASKPQAQPAAHTPSHAQSMIQDLDTTIAFHSKRVEQHPSSWLDHERIARAYMSRARLTGSYDDYKRADTSIATAFQHAKKGSGPFLTRAQLNLTLHRFDLVENDLDSLSKRLLLPSKQRAAIASMRAELLFAQGQYEKGSEHLRQALTLQTNAGRITRMAHVMRVLGKRDEARTWLDRAVKHARTESDFMYAWTLLQRGLIELEEEKLTRAMHFYDKANLAFSGWYLIEEHRAEIFSLTQQPKRAETLYRSILQTTPSPEFMDALADVVENQGNTQEAASLRAQASETYQTQLRNFPHATYSHAFDHFLHTQPKLALQLAQKDHALRPGPESTLRLLQARALHNDLSDAHTLLESIQKRGFSTPEFHATAAWIYTRTQDPQNANIHKTKATSIAPNILNELAWLNPTK